MRHLYIIIALVLGAGILGSTANAQSIYFENIASGNAVTRTDWEDQGFTVPWDQGMDTRTEINTTYAHEGSKALRVFYPKDAYGTSGTGMQAPLEVTPRDEYYISYWLRFSDNFSWGSSSTGGKLPGLAGGDRCSGCTTCDGTNGFTARFMWRESGRAVLYLYHMDKPGSCGEDIQLVDSTGANMHFPRGQWIHIEQRVKINSGSNHDGEVQVWYNDQEVLNLTGLQFVNNGDKVDNLYFSTFHGGNDAGWAPQNDSYIWFDQVVVSEQRHSAAAGFSQPVPQQPAMYPNPFQKQLNLKFPGYRQGRISLSTPGGKTVHQSSFHGAKVSLSIPELPSGLYFLHVISNQGVTVQKVYKR